MLLKKVNTIMLFLIICALCGCRTNKFAEIPSVTGEFDFTILKAGQADAIIMKTENYSIMIDCGEKDDGKKICEYLRDNGIQNIDYMFITHFDKDHIGGFSKVMENVTASSIMVPDYIGSNSEYKDYLETIKNNGLEVTVLREDISFVLDDVLFEVSVSQKQSYAEGDNDFSVVISITHGENTFLFTGDAEEERLYEVLNRFGSRYDFLKVPHHGKHNNNTKPFIRTVKPQYAVVTDSQKNPASDETLSILRSVGCEIYSTKNGDVSVKSDGVNINIMQ